MISNDALFFFDVSKNASDSIVLPIFTTEKKNIESEKETTTKKNLNNIIQDELINKNKINHVLLYEGTKSNLKTLFQNDPLNMASIMNQLGVSINIKKKLNPIVINHFD
jgi:hypothetical protein